VQHWDITGVTAPDGSRSPQVLYSQEGERRIVAIHLLPGQELGDHQVKEAALLLVADGQVRVEAGDESIDARPGMLVRFEPGERHTVSAAGEARVLLLLAPWPAAGHYQPGELQGSRSGVSASSPDAR
jgi:quercetin dioxygenase-like cupin family protein